MERKIVRIPVYIAFGLASFLIALGMTFPDERVKEIAVVQMESQLGNKYDVSVDDLDIWWLSGVSLEGIKLSKREVEGGQKDSNDQKGASKSGNAANAPSGKASAGKGSAKSGGQVPEQKPMELDIPEVGVRFAPLSSLFNFSPTVVFAVETGGGEIGGEYIHGSEERTVEVDIDEVTLKDTQILSSIIGLPVFGQLNGQINLTLHPKKPIVTGGELAFQGRQLTLGSGTITSSKFGPMGFIDVPQTNFGTLEAKLVITESKGGRRRTKLAFESLSLKGRDIRGEVWGDILLGRGLRGSRAKLEMRFQFDNSYVQKNNLQSVLNIKWLREGKAGSWHGFVLTGSMAKPDFRGAPTAAKGPPDKPKGGNKPAPSDKKKP